MLSFVGDKNGMEQLPEHDIARNFVSNWSSFVDGNKAYPAGTICFYVMLVNGKSYEAAAGH